MNSGNLLQTVSIIPFGVDYLEGSAQLFVSEYSQASDSEWSIKAAKHYLMRDFKQAPDFCFVAVNEFGELLGNIFCKIDQHYKRKLLFIDTIQVIPEYRRQGIAKRLFKTVVDAARRHPEITGIHLLAEINKESVRDWYSKMGFKETGWIEYEVDLDNLRV